MDSPMAALFKVITEKYIFIYGATSTGGGYIRCQGANFHWFDF